MRRRGDRKDDKQIRERTFHKARYNRGPLHECGRDYDIREVRMRSSIQPPTMSAEFDCPKGHHCEARRVWHSYDDEFLRACGIEGPREGTYEGHKEHRERGPLERPH